MLYEALIGRKRFHTKVITKPADIIKGSSGFPSLPNNNGMLFMLRAPQEVELSMHGVEFDLDVGLFTPDGKLEEIMHLKVGDKERPTTESKHIQYVLHMNSGWFAKNSVDLKSDLCLMVKTPLWSIIDTVQLMETMESENGKEAKPLRMRPIDVSEIIVETPPDK